MDKQLADQQALNDRALDLCVRVSSLKLPRPSFRN